MIGKQTLVFYLPIEHADGNKFHIFGKMHSATVLINEITQK